MPVTGRSTLVGSPASPDRPVAGERGQGIGEDEDPGACRGCEVHIMARDAGAVTVGRAGLADIQGLADGHGADGVDQAHLIEAGPAGECVREGSSEVSSSEDGDKRHGRAKGGAGNSL